MKASDASTYPEYVAVAIEKVSEFLATDKVRALSACEPFWINDKTVRLVTL